MNFRVLHGSGLRLSAVGLGGVELGGGDTSDGEPSLGEAIAVVGATLEAGVTWLDTAEAYHAHRNERFIGEILRHTGDELLLSTKLAPAPCGGGYRPDEVHAGCRASLARLGREQIDIYLLHLPDETGVPLEDTWDAMGQLVEQGLVRAIGLSNYGLDAVERCHAQRPVDIVQDGLSLIDHLDNRPLFERCHRLGIGVAVYEPLGSGTLSGQSIDQVRQAWADWAEFGFYKRLLAGENGDASAAFVDALRPIAAHLETTVPQLAIAWVLHQKGVTAAIAGSRNPSHVRQNAEAADLTISETILAQLQAVIPLGPTVAAGP